MMLLNKELPVFVTGHKGMVGSAIVRKLQEQGFSNILKASHSECDLTNYEQVDSFFKKHKPAYIFLSAARVGGIGANSKYPVEFLTENLHIELNIFKAAHEYKVQKLCFLGSSCIYPKACPQPMKEEYLLTGPLEPTNEGYALAKICGLKMAEYYHKEYGLPSICAMPCNLYGTNDHFDLETSHVLSSLVRRFCDAVDNKDPSVTLWGTGIARREFMHVDDCASASIFLMENGQKPEIVNIGWGTDVTIKELATIIAQKTGFKGAINWDSTKPNGMLKKCLDTSKIQAMGFQPKITLDQGIDKTIKEYRILKAAGKIK